MIDKDDLRVAELQALADLGTADVGTIVSHMPPRLAAVVGNVRADLGRLEGKGLIKRVSGYMLTDEGREILAAILRIRGAFPGPGKTPATNGASKADE